MNDLEPLDWVNVAHNDLTWFYLEHFDYPNKVYLWERWVRV